MAKILLDVVSDIVCPWCWLGKRRLEAALAASPEIEVEVSYRPHELDPQVPSGGVPYRDYMHAKFGDGDDNRFKAMRAHLEAAAPREGIRFRFDEIPKRVNTLDAHRVVRWAQGQGKAAEANEALFRAFFDELRDVGAHAVLTSIAGEIGMDAALVAELLATDRDTREVREEEAFFQRLGVTGVPTFIANGRLALPGAAEPETIAAFLREAGEHAPAEAR